MTGWRWWWHQIDAMWHDGDDTIRRFNRLGVGCIAFGLFQIFGLLGALGTVFQATVIGLILTALGFPPTDTFGSIPWPGF